MDQATLECCGIAEISNFPFDGGISSDKEYRKKDLQSIRNDLHMEIERARRHNRAVMIASTINQQSQSAKILSSMGFVDAHGVSHRRDSNKGNSITLWTRGVHEYTEEEDRILAEGD